MRDNISDLPTRYSQVLRRISRRAERLDQLFIQRCTVCQYMSHAASSSHELLVVQIWNLPLRRAKGE